MASQTQGEESGGRLPVVGPDAEFVHDEHPGREAHLLWRLQWQACRRSSGIPTSSWASFWWWLRFSWIWVPRALSGRYPFTTARPHGEAVRFSRLFGCSGRTVRGVGSHLGGPPPPHGMMVIGAGILAIGLVLITLSRGFGATVAGLFLVGAGGSALGSLVFYAIAVKGFARFKGTLIGTLGLAFAVNLGPETIGTWEVGIPIGW